MSSDRLIGLSRWWIAACVFGREFWCYPFAFRCGHEHGGGKLFAIAVGRSEE